MIGLLGILVFIGIGFLLSNNKTCIDWKTISCALGLQWIFAILVLKGEWLALSLSVIPFPKGMGWITLGLMFVPSLHRKLTSQPVNNLFLSWIVPPIIFISIVRGNLVGSSFDRMRIVVESLMSYAGKGADFIFGPLQPPTYFIFAFTVLPVIIFVASLFAIFIT